MGCDIHIVVQRKVDGKWQTTNNYEPFDGRDYVVFGILADVRGQGYEPIDLPRGLPEGFEYRNDHEDVYDFYHLDTWLGDHSHSWLLLSEVIDYDWDQQYEPDTNEPTLRERCSHFLKFVAGLKEIDSSPANVRLVFGFDS